MIVCPWRYARLMLILIQTICTYVQYMYFPNDLWYSSNISAKTTFIVVNEYVTKQSHMTIIRYIKKTLEATGYSLDCTSQITIIAFRADRWQEKKQPNTWPGTP